MEQNWNCFGYSKKDKFCLGENFFSNDNPGAILRKSCYCTRELFSFQYDYFLQTSSKRKVFVKRFTQLDKDLFLLSLFFWFA